MIKQNDYKASEHRNIARPLIVAFSVIMATGSLGFANANSKDKSKTEAVEKILNQTHPCSDTIVIRSQALSKAQQENTCRLLAKQESRFHQLFLTRNKPVRHDLNTSLRVNVYHSRDDFVKHAASHFNMPTDNGGMYLEGFPDQTGNQAEFITYQKGDVIWNLQHEYVHYLDGRFNLYGDFCDSLHDSHSPPENCAKPAPLFPHTTWWTEGIAEYIAKGDSHPRAFDAVNNDKNQYQLSELFDTGYLKNGGGTRVYFWGYFAARFMMEQERDKVESMLTFLREGDFPRYQALIRSWGTSMDQKFEQWLKALLSIESE